MTIEYFMDMEHNRLRTQRDFGLYDLSEGLLTRCFQVELFDGERAQWFYPRDRNRDRFDEARKAGPWRGDLEFLRDDGPTVGREDLAVMLAHGMVLVDSGSTLGPSGTLRRTLVAELFDEYGRAVREGREYIVLRSRPDRARPRPTFNEFWVDVDNASAIVRFVRYIGDSETLQIDMWYEEDEPHGHRLAHYTYTEEVLGAPVETREMHVLEYEPEPLFADSLFYVEPQPGFNVYDHATDRQYRVGLPGEPDRDLRDLWREAQQHGRRGRTMPVLFVSLNVVAVIVLAFLYRCRRRK